MSALVKVFGCRPDDDGAAGSGAGVGKPPREETAGDGAKRFRVHYGDLIAAAEATEHWRGDAEH